MNNIYTNSTTAPKFNYTVSIEKDVSKFHSTRYWLFGKELAKIMPDIIKFEKNTLPGIFNDLAIESNVEVEIIGYYRKLAIITDNSEEICFTHFLWTSDCVHMDKDLKFLVKFYTDYYRKSNFRDKIVTKICIKYECESKIQ